MCAPQTPAATQNLPLVSASAIGLTQLRKTPPARPARVKMEALATAMARVTVWEDTLATTARRRHALKAVCSVAARVATLTCARVALTCQSHATVMGISGSFLTASILVGANHAHALKPDTYVR